MSIISLVILLPCLGFMSGQVFAQEGLPAESAVLSPLASDLDAQATENNEEAVNEADGRAELGDIWNSSDVFGNKILTGTDITSQVIVEQILEPEGDYRYAAFGKPDPFLPPYEILAGLAETTAVAGGESKVIPRNATGEEIAIISPLQTDLENLSVIGMWELDDGTRKALISNGAAQAVAVEVGDPIGYTGRVSEIRPEGVITRQYSLREDGSREYEDVLLLFGDKEELLKQQIGQRVLLTPGGGAEVKEIGPRINEPAKAKVPDGVNTPANRIPDANNNMNEGDPAFNKVKAEGDQSATEMNGAQSPVGDYRGALPRSGNPQQLNPGTPQADPRYGQPGIGIGASPRARSLNTGYNQPNTGIQQPNKSFQQPYAQ